MVATQEDLVAALKITRRMVEGRLKKVFRIYDLQEKWFKKDFQDEGNVPYDFPAKAFELVKVMVRAVDNYPLAHGEKQMEKPELVEKRKENVTSSQLVSFYQELLQSIDEELGDALKREIKAHPIYFRTIAELEGISFLSSKFSHFLAASNEISDDARMTLWTRLYETMDELIYDCFDVKMILQEEYEKQVEAIEAKYKQTEWSTHADEGQTQNNQFNMIQERKELELNRLHRQHGQQLTIRTLDGLIVSMIKEEVLKNHYKTKVNLGVKIGGKRKRPRPQEYDPMLIENTIRLETLEQAVKDQLDPYHELIKRVTGYDVEELEQMKLNQLEKKIEAQIEVVRNQFSTIETTEKKALYYFQESQGKDNSPSVEHLGRRNIGRELQSIRNQLFHLHENIDGVLYETLTDREKLDYSRVKEMVEQTLGQIEMLQQPSKIKEGQMQAFYQSYVDFYRNTQEKSKVFERQGEIFALKPSIEALDGKVRDQTE